MKLLPGSRLGSGKMIKLRKATGTNAGKSVVRFAMFYLDMMKPRTKRCSQGIGNTTGDLKRQFSTLELQINMKMVFLMLGNDKQV